MGSASAAAHGGELARRPELLDAVAYTRLEHAPSVRGYLWQLASVTGWPSLPYLWRIGQPTLVLYGEEDPIVRPVDGRILARLIPHARLELNSGGGHLFLLDQPGGVGAVDRRFLKARG